MRDQKKREPIHLFTSECVSVGHPDKLADYISDTIVSEILKADPKARIAAECACYDTGVLLMGEVTTEADVDYDALVRKAVKEVGYIHKDCPFNVDEIQIENHIHSQSPDIAMGTNDEVQGAGDQGLMFGGACIETSDLMPLPITIARALIVRATELIQEHIDDEDPILRPDAKSQVTVAYGKGHQPKYIDTVVMSCSHSAAKDIEEVRAYVLENIVKPVVEEFDFDINDIPHIYINPTGRFAAPYYGPFGDSGLTGRKIIVDTYGGTYPHGGGAFSSKDPSKVDRTAAYYARYIAKNIVAAGLADNCQIQLAYAIGIAKPVSINIQTFGTQKYPVGLIAKAVNNIFDCTPAGMTKDLQMREGLDYQLASVYGHFGEYTPTAWPWELCDRTAELLDYIESNYRPVE